MTQKHIRSILRSRSPQKTHQHGIALQQFKQLPELLEKPLAVITRKEHAEIIVAVLDAKDAQGNQLIVPIRRDGYACYMGKRIEADFILSTYGKHNFASYLEKAELEGGILFVDNKISTKPGKVPLQLRQLLRTGAYADIIPHQAENVKIINKENGISAGHAETLKKDREIPQKNI